MDNLVTQVRGATGDDRDLAIDILIGLAARTDPTGAVAQEALRKLYAQPKAGSPHADAQLRRELLSASHAMCELVLHKATTSPPLSVTVAYLGGQCADPPEGQSGNVMRERIEEHIRDQFRQKNVTMETSENLLGRNRLVADDELKAASKSLKNVQQHYQTLNMASEEQFTTPLKEVQQNLSSHGNTTQAAWVHAGSDYRHWMPMVVHKKDGDTLHYHVIDSNKSVTSTKQTQARAQPLLATAGISAQQVTFHSADMQTHAPNGCGPLGWRLLKALDEALDSGTLQPNDDLGDFIKKHINDWSQLQEPDQVAAMVAARAELLQAWADKT